MNINIPELSLVLLIGPSSCGKSTFAKKHFLQTEVISSDYCRALVSDGESNDSTKDAFDVLHFITEKRLKRGKLTVIDATNVQSHSRKSLIEIAKKYHCFVVAIVFDIPENVLKERHKSRNDRNFGFNVIINQRIDMKKSFGMLKKEGIKFIYTLENIEDIENAIITKQLLFNNKKTELGPFDIIGDIHGCFDELKELLEKLNYIIEKTEDEENYGFKITHPKNRKLIFLGDLVDRGEKVVDVLKLVMSAVKNNIAFCVPGNHDAKLLKYLNGANVTLKHGLEKTVEQLSGESSVFISKLKEFIDSLVSHYVFDEGKLVVSHGGLREEMHGRGSSEIRSFCLYGETTGENDEYGLPVRYDWASEYNGKAKVIYGHTPVFEHQWFNNTINIDTGCVFGGSLTALRYPESGIISVKAKKEYYKPSKPIEIIKNTIDDDMLNIDDLRGKLNISTNFNKVITIKEENSVNAIEFMSRFAINPKWLVYLPPTMSPAEVSNFDNYLEHPKEALNYFKANGVQTVICEEKHMGSRAVVIVCKNKEIPAEKFKISQKTLGICYTRTGRRFFNDINVENELLERLCSALSKANFWDNFKTDFVVLDCELMPWSAKARELIKSQYAAVGTSGKNALKNTIDVIQKAKERGLPIEEIENIYIQKYNHIINFEKAYSQYCKEINGIEGIKLAPFHILATENAVHFDKSHIWHMENIAAFCDFDKDLFLKTPYKTVDLNDENSVNDVINWWENLTSNGGEGMVVKPIDFLTKGEKDIVQPAIKCRGKEYLRIIYGYDYCDENNLALLKHRSLQKKRYMAMNEFLLGLESLTRFINNEPLRKIHECVFGVLALESEEVDPRL